MILKKLQFTVALLVFSGALYGGGSRDNRFLLPVGLWAQVAVVPPGTNDTRLPATQPGTPESPASASPAAIPDAPVPGEAPVTSPATAIPNEPSTQTPTAPGVAPGTPGQIAPAPGRAPEVSKQPGEPTLPPNCSVTVAQKEISIGYQGGQVRFAPVFSRPDCATEPLSSEMWIQPMEGQLKDGAYLFRIEPNTTRSPREGSIYIGTAISVVNQAAGKFASFAAAPSRIEISAADKDKKHTIAAWSDQADLVLEATTATPWLKVIPGSGNKKAGAQKFIIELAPAEMKPGRHEGAVEIIAPDTVNDPIRIPVVITVPEKK